MSFTIVFDVFDEYKLSWWIIYYLHFCWQCFLQFGGLYVVECNGVVPTRSGVGDPPVGGGDLVQFLQLFLAHFVHEAGADAVAQHVDHRSEAVPEGEHEIIVKFLKREQVIIVRSLKGDIK